MNRFSQQEFNNLAIEYNVVGFFEKPIKLKSGRQSPFYVNWRDVTEDVYGIDKLTDFIIAFTEDNELEPDCFYGVPEGATKTGIITQFKWARKSPNYGKGSHILPMGRGKPKDHGAPKDRYFIGQPHGKVIVIEDVATTGGSLLREIDRLFQLPNVEIIAAYVLTDRMERRDDGRSVKEAVEDMGVKYYALSNAPDLLKLACKVLRPPEEVISSVEEYYKRYGIKTISLREC